ncbi:MAG: LysM peptidoglycan-binding domain-containing protein, partial [Nanoarchaeota archaeon]|nr:LysM peptidoglycan-binding domain-containing protein [Nanoarchaeota archaeon]
FLKPESTPMPAELQAHDHGSGRRSAMWRTVSALIVLAVLVAVVLWQAVARGLFSLPAQQGDNTSAATLTVLSAAPSVPTGSANPILTPTVVATPLSPTPTFTPTQIASPTPTTQPVLNLALEVPIGLHQRFMIHRVMEGESLELFARRYATTIEAIQAVNYYLPSPLLVNWTVVIPLESIDVQGLPAFQPYMVVASMTVEEFAQSMSVDVSTLSYYNGLTATYQLSPGDWLLIPR